MMTVRLTSVQCEVTVIIECGIVTAIGLMKCGSSNIRKTFVGKHWEAHQFLDSTPRYVTAIRNPAHRLVSCWNHLVAAKVETTSLDCSKFGPHVVFPDWVRWVIEQNPDTLNTHIRPQTDELVDALREVDGLIWIMQLERAQELAKGALTEWLQWPVAMPNKQRHKAYGYWPDYYDDNLLQKVRKYFEADYRLWMSIHAKGFEVFQIRRLTQGLGLTDGCQREIVAGKL